MKSKEQLKTLRKLDAKKLHKKLNDEYTNLHELRFSTKFRNQKDTKATDKSKKTIARIYTILNEKINQEEK